MAANLDTCNIMVEICMQSRGEFHDVLSSLLLP